MVPGERQIRVSAPPDMASNLQAIAPMKLAATVFLALSLYAQESRFDVRSRLVVVPVIVSNDKGRFVDGLEPADFVVLDNGRPQPAIVDTIDTGVAPIALVVAVQSSGIFAPVIEKVRRIGAMIQPLVTGDRGSAAVVSFDQKATWLTDFTNDEDRIDRAFKSLKALTRPGEDKEARMLDTASAAIEKLQARPNSRRVLLLISETRDRGSETTLEQVMASAQTAGITIYAVTFSALKSAFASKVPVAQPRRAIKPKTPNDETGIVNGMPPGKYNPWPKKPPPEQQVDALGGIAELKRLAQANATMALTKATGGTTFPFTREKTLVEAIQKFGAELHNQYVISFVPEAHAAGYHTLEVRIARSGEFQVRARPGYWSTDEAH